MRPRTTAANKIAQFFILYFLLGVVHYPREIETSPIYFTPVSDICKTKEITAHQVGKITSPSYPDDCKNKSLDCKLDLKIPPSKQLRIEIERLKINYSTNCTEGAISITEYQWSENEARETRFCGRYFGQKIPIITYMRKAAKRPKDGDVMVRFITKGNTAGSKFLLRYEIIDIPKNPDTTFVTTKDLIAVVAPLFVVLVVAMAILECKRQRPAYKPSTSVTTVLENGSTGRSPQKIQEGATTMNGIHGQALEQESGETTPAPAKIAPYKVTTLPVNTQPLSTHTGLDINTPQNSLNGESLHIIHDHKSLNRDSGYVIPLEGNEAVPCQKSQAIIPPGYTELDINAREDPQILNEARTNGGYQELLKRESGNVIAHDGTTT